MLKQFYIAHPFPPNIFLLVIKEFKVPFKAYLTFKWTKFYFIAILKLSLI